MLLLIFIWDGEIILKNGILYIILTSVVFTTLEPVSKLIANEISPMMITFLRFFLGGIILLPFSVLKIKKQNITLVKKDYISMLLLGILCICVSMVLSKKLMTKVAGIIQTSFSFLSGSLVLLIVLSFSGDNTIVNINVGNLIYLIYLGLGVTGIGYWSYFKAMEKASALAASSVFFYQTDIDSFRSIFYKWYCAGLKFVYSIGTGACRLLFVPGGYA